MDRKQIIMNFSLPPGLDDIAVMADEVLENLPDELVDDAEDLVIQVDDFPDEAVESELDLDDSYDLLCLFRSGKEVSPGVEKKVTGDDDVLILYRRPILDMWCENEEDIHGLLRTIILEELGKNFDFSEDEIEEMTARHHQGLL